MVRWIYNVSIINLLLLSSDNDITGILHNTFSVEHNAFGELQSNELKPNGAQEDVTESNKKEYVKLFVTWRVMRGIENQFSYLQKGFHELVSQHLLRPFDERELEVVYFACNLYIYLCYLTFYSSV